MTACSSSGHAPQDYVAWVEDPKNGLHQEAVVGEYRYAVQYAPHEYLALMNNKREVANAKALINDLESYSGFDYFILRIANGQTFLPSGQSLNEKWYGESHDYFAFWFQQDLIMAVAGDTLPCQVYHFEGENSMKQQLSFMIAFENDMSGSRTLVIRDRAFTNDRIEFLFDEERIASIPKPKV